jgi:hypothetical protein
LGGVGIGKRNAYIYIRLDESEDGWRL